LVAGREEREAGPVLIKFLRLNCADPASRVSPTGEVRVFAVLIRVDP
jgi:hypothetical protein